MFLVSIGNDATITAFLNPHAINAGGATGLSTVISEGIRIPFAIVYGLVNLPILYLGVRYLSVRYSLYSVFVTVVTTVLFPYLQNFTIHMPTLYATMLGAVIYGISVGATYRYDFSLGGFALLAKVLETITSKNVGSIFTVINFIPVLLNAFTVRPSGTFLWSIVFIVITGEVINWTAMGKGYQEHWKARFGKVFHRRVRRHVDERLKKAS